jgi:PhzF family phenazine biosynthesis protein
VWIGADLPEPAEMQRIAAEVGYSETAFLAPDGTGRPGAHRVRYFSPAAEVPFCGHGTIASGVAMAERSGPGRLLLELNDGLVALGTNRGPAGRLWATLTSVRPRVRSAEADLVAAALAALGWTHAELDPALPPAVAYAGASHRILAAASYDTLGALAWVRASRSQWTLAPAPRRHLATEHCR